MTENSNTNAGTRGIIPQNRSGRTFFFGCLLAFSAAAAWGASSVTGRVLYGNALDSFDPMTVNFFRFLLGSLVLNVFLFSTGRGKEVGKAVRADWKLLILCGIFGVVLEGSFQLLSVTLTTAARSSLFGSTSPVFTMLLAAVFLKERQGILRWLGLSAAATGMTMLFFCGGGDLYGTASMRLGDILAVCSSVSWSVYTIAIQRISRKYDGLVCTAVMMPVGTLILLPAAYFRGGLAFSSMTLTPGFCIGVLYLGAVACGLAYLCWAQAGKYLPAGTLGAFGFVNLLLSLLLSVIFLHEQVSWSMAASVAVIVAGTVLMVSRKQE